MEVVDNLGKEFFKLLKRNFLATDPLHKIVDRNSIKLSYSCMPNIINKSKIMKHKKNVRRPPNVIVRIR